MIQISTAIWSRMSFHVLVQFKTNIRLNIITSSVNQSLQWYASYFLKSVTKADIFCCHFRIARRWASSSGHAPFKYWVFFMYRPRDWPFLLQYEHLLFIVPGCRFPCRNSCDNVFFSSWFSSLALFKAGLFLSGPIGGGNFVFIIVADNNISCGVSSVLWWMLCFCGVVVDIHSHGS